MIKAILIGLMILFNQNHESINENKLYFEELKSKVSLNNNEYLIVLFISINECLNCQEVIFKALDCVSKNAKNKLKIIGVIRANRAKEIFKIKDRLAWNYFLSFDDGTSKTKLNLNENTQIVIFKSNGKSLLNLGRNEVKTIPLCNYIVEKIIKDNNEMK
jgi:hypothetical protein